VSASYSDIKPRKRSSRHVWFHGDCQELLTSIEDESVSLVLTSPPYNVGKEYEERLDLSKYLVWQRKVIGECVRATKKTGSICWQVGNYARKGRIVPLDILLYPIFREFGLQLRNRIIWHYPHGLHFTNRFSGRYETVLWFTRSDSYYFDLDAVRVPQKNPRKKHFKGPKKGQFSCNPLGKNPGDVWELSNIKFNHPEKINGGHPCQMPLTLVDRLILSLTQKEDLILDPFGGSGTTVVAAKKHGRVGLGAEIEKKYFLIGEKRLAELQPSRNSGKRPPSDITL